MDKKDFFNLGNITRCNRKTAELTISFDAGQPEGLTGTDVIFIEIDGGLVPFFVKNIRPKNHDNCLVVLEDFDTPDKAERLVGNKVFLSDDQQDELSDDQFFANEIIGYEVIDEVHGAIGIIEHIIENTQQEILQIRFNKKEILIPLVEQIFTKISRKQKKLFVNAPEGLIDLYLNQ